MNRDTEKLAEVMNQLESKYIYQIFHPKTKEYIFFSALQSPISKTDHIVGHKTGLNRYKNVEIIPLLLSDDHRLRLFFNNKNDRKPTYTWKLKNALFSDNLVKKERNK